MRIKKLLSAVLAAAMVCGLLCVPAFAASANKVLTGPDDLWVDGGLKREMSFTLRFWTKENDVIAREKNAEEPAKMTVIEVPLGSSITAGPNNQWVSEASVFSDPDGDGIYDLRLDRLTYNVDGELIDIETIPVADNGPFTETKTESYRNRYDWGWGLDTFEPDFNSRSSFNGYRTLTADFVLDVFGPNTLIQFWNTDETRYANYLFTGKEPSEPLSYDRLEDHGIYFANNYSNVVSGWAVDPVNAATDAGLIAYGMEVKHDFDLREKITRAEFAHLAVNVYYNLSGTDRDSLGGLENPFEDVNEDTLFETGILAAYKLGIVTGKTDTLFRPDALVTRQEAAAMLSRAYTKAGGTIPAVTATTFADNADIQNYARDAVAFMSSHEIINGVGGNRFNPKGDASVEQALKIAVEMLQKLG